MKKQALSSVWAALLGAIVFAVSTLVLIQLLSKGGQVATDVAEHQQCLDSVRAQALIGKIKPDSPVNLRCRTRYVTVTQTDVKAQQLAVAKEMRNCYSQLGEGKVNLFDLEQGSYCVVCAKMEFAKPGRLDHFTQFLLDTKVPQGTQTYYQYLFGASDTDEVAQAYRGSAVANQDAVDTTKSLAVIYLQRKNVNSWGDYIATTVAGAGFAVGSVLTLTGVGAPVGVPLMVVSAGAGATAAAATHYVAGPYLTTQESAAATILWPYDEIGAFECNKLEGRAGPLEFVD